MLYCAIHGIVGDYTSLCPWFPKNTASGAVPGGGKGKAAPIIFKKNENEKEKHNRKKNEKKGEKIKKIKKIIKNNQNAVYKWVKTYEFLWGVTPSSPIFLMSAHLQTRQWSLIH